MSETNPTELAAVQAAAIKPLSIKDTVLAQFKEAETTITTLANRYRDVAYDVKTPKGMKDAIAARADLRDNGRLFLTRAETRIKGEVNDLKRVMADEVERLVAIVKPVEEAVDAQIKAEEQRKAAEKAERERIAKEAEAARVAAELAAARAELEALRQKQAEAERAAAFEQQAEAQRQAREAEEKASQVVQKAAAPIAAAMTDALTTDTGIASMTAEEVTRIDPATVRNDATLKLGDINTRLAPLQITQEGLESLGFRPVNIIKNARLYRESDFPRICVALINHIQGAVALV